MARKRTKDNYEVGYGKPPKDSQFLPGQSGNPKGRPKNTPNLKTAIIEILSKSVTVRQDGAKRTVSSLEAVLLRQLQKALEGNQGAAQHILSLFAQHSEIDPEGGGYEITGDDLEILQGIVAGSKVNEEGGPDGTK